MYMCMRGVFLGGCWGAVVDDVYQCNIKDKCVQSEALL